MHPEQLLRARVHRVADRFDALLLNLPDLLRRVHDAVRDRSQARHEVAHAADDRLGGLLGRLRALQQLGQFARFSAQRLAQARRGVDAVPAEHELRSADDGDDPAELRLLLRVLQIGRGLRTMPGQGVNRGEQQQHADEHDGGDRNVAEAGPTGQPAVEPRLPELEEGPRGLRRVTRGEAAVGARGQGQAGPGHQQRNEHEDAEHRLGRAFPALFAHGRQPRPRQIQPLPGPGARRAAEPRLQDRERRRDSTAMARNGLREVLGAREDGKQVELGPFLEPVPIPVVQGVRELSNQPPRSLGEAGERMQFHGERLAGDGAPVGIRAAAGHQRSPQNSSQETSTPAIHRYRRWGIEITRRLRSSKNRAARMLRHVSTDLPRVSVRQIACRLPRGRTGGRVTGGNPGEGVPPGDPPQSPLRSPVS